MVSNSKPFSLIKAQPQYTLEIQLSLSQREITLDCGCFGLTSLPMLKYEIITELEKRGIFIHKEKMQYHDGGRFVDLIDIKCLNKKSTLLVVEPGLDDVLVQKHIIGNKLKVCSQQIEFVYPKVFDKFLTLQEIDLSGCSISSLSHGIFHALTNLQSINLEKNKLTSLPADLFLCLTKLRHLNVSGNRFNSEPISNVFTATSLTSLDLSFNPLDKFLISWFFSVN